MRKVGYISGLVLLLCLTVSLGAAAQETPKAEAFFNYSYLRFNPATSGASSFNMNGGSANVAVNPSSWLGIVGDVGGYHVGKIGSTSVNGSLYTYLFGPRLSYRHSERFTPFAQALFGGAHASASAFGLPASANSFAMSVGGGLDVKATNHFGLRLGQVEYLMTRFPETGSRVTQNNLRVSTGIVFRF